jgi:prephenate dehydratase
MSRPTKSEMGKYIFYFEFQIIRDSIEKIYKLKEDLSSQYKLDLLGIYNRL